MRQQLIGYWLKEISMFDYKLTGVLLATLTFACGAPSLPPTDETSEMPAVESQSAEIADVVYGHKDGMALTFDVFKPASSANGAGILYIESGGWRSRWRPFDVSKARFEKLLDSGFTVFIIRHGSAPRFNVHDAYLDVQRAARFVRMHAGDYGVDPSRLGVHGGSAGGHLSLMLGLTSDEGDPTAEDEVLRGSNRVAAVVAYYPPVDLRPRSSSEGDFPPLTTDSYFYSNGLDNPRAVDRFGALNLEPDVAASVSPILFASADDPPTMLVHGDADVIVDLNNSQIMHAALMEQNVATELVMIEGAAHVFPNAENRTKAMDALVGFFETHLVGD
jgi:acetyl esterase/lipase